VIDDNGSFAARLQAAGNRVRHVGCAGRPHAGRVFRDVVPQRDAAVAAVAAVPKRTVG